MRLGGRKVLVSQRENIIEIDIQQVLERLGADVVIGDPSNLFHEKEWDCAVLDGKRCEAVMEQLKKSTVPLVIYTGLIDPVAFKGAIYLTKPASDDQLADGLLRAMSSKRVAQA